MTTRTRSRIYVSIAAMILTAALAVPAAAQQQVPFKGTFQGSDTVTPPATIATAATGTGTHLGQFSFTHVLTLNTSTGSAHWVAANGDSIESTSVVSAVPGPVVFTVTEIHTITVGRVDSRAPRGALPCTAHTSGRSVTMERTSPSAGSKGLLLPRVQLAENSQQPGGEGVPSRGVWRPFSKHRPDRLRRQPKTRQFAYLARSARQSRGIRSSVTRMVS